jgi:single-stranded DNA-binding protein
MWYNSIGRGRGDVTAMIEFAFTGVLGRDAEIRASAKGRQYFKLNLRVAEAYDAQWVSVISFDPNAVPLAGTFVKGAKVSVEGRISMNESQDQSGVRAGGNRQLQPAGADRSPSATRP